MGYKAKEEKEAKGHKTKEWLWRYVPPFTISTIFTLFFANFINSVVENDILVAYITVWGMTFVYYGFLISREIYYVYRKEHKVTFLDIGKIFRNLIFEFGPSELVDFFFVAPFFLYIAPKLIANYTLAILIGKLCCDSIYYGLAIISYETRKRIWE